MLTKDLKEVLSKIIDILYEGHMNEQQYKELLEELDKIPTCKYSRY